MDCFTSMPSVVTKTFYEKYEDGPRVATDYNLDDAKKQEIGIIFGKILENCGVLKNTEKGNEGIVIFIKSVK